MTAEIYEASPLKRPRATKDEAKLIHGWEDPWEIAVSVNINRRHLTKEVKADRLVAIVKAKTEYQASSRSDISRHDGEKPKSGGRPKDPVKETAVELGEQHGISKRTIERATAKAAGKPPQLGSPRARCRSTVRPGHVTEMPSIPRPRRDRRLPRHLPHQARSPRPRSRPRTTRSIDWPQPQFMVRRAPA
jgi:hypothetical protein